MKRAFITWAEQRADVRAAILQGSRATRRGQEDELSDWDIALFVDDPDALTGEAGWFEAFGPVLVSIPESFEEFGRRVATRLVQYADGNRIDFMIFPSDVLRVISILPELPPWLDAGYEVLYDEDGVTGPMVPPHGRGFAGRPPSPEEVLADVEEFWWEALVVAKELVRGKEFAAANSAESVLRHGLLLRMLEWRAGIESGWSDPAGPFGRGLETRLPEELQERARPQITSWRGDEAWTELLRMADLYAEVARAVAADLGVAYPDAMEVSARAALSGRRALTESPPAP